MIALLGCARLTATYSVFEVRDGSFQEVQSLVDEAFSKLSYSGGKMLYGQLQRSYESWGEKNKFGVPTLYSFMVTYKLTDAVIVIRIENKKLGASQEDLERINEHLSLITNNIDRKLKEDRVNATVLTGSRSFPALGELP
jgi:hypothetical protein